MAQYHLDVERDRAGGLDRLRLVAMSVEPGLDVDAVLDGQRDLATDAVDGEASGDAELVRGVDDTDAQAPHDARTVLPGLE